MSKEAGQLPWLDTAAAQFRRDGVAQGVGAHRQHGVGHLLGLLQDLRRARLVPSTPRRQDAASGIVPDHQSGALADALDRRPDRLQRLVVEQDHPARRDAHQEGHQEVGHGNRRPVFLVLAAARRVEIDDAGFEVELAKGRQLQDRARPRRGAERQRDIQTDMREIVGRGTDEPCRLHHGHRTRSRLTIGRQLHEGRAIQQLFLDGPIQGALADGEDAADVGVRIALAVQRLGEGAQRCRVDLRHQRTRKLIGPFGEGVAIRNGAGLQPADGIEPPHQDRFEQHRLRLLAIHLRVLLHPCR
nr:hypothetical protein [Reyranella sp.]